MIKYNFLIPIVTKTKKYLVKCVYTKLIVLYHLCYMWKTFKFQIINNKHMGKISTDNIGILVDYIHYNIINKYVIHFNKKYIS